MCASDYPNLNNVVPSSIGHRLTVVEGEATAAQPKPDRLPIRFGVSAVYPNPFNSVATIDYQLPEAGATTLSIYTLNGRRIADLVSEYAVVGTYQVTWNAQGETSGVYFVHLSAGDYQMTRKVLLLK
jgi:hypothetical protein